MMVLLHEGTEQIFMARVTLMLGLLVDAMLFMEMFAASNMPPKVLTLVLPLKHSVDRLLNQMKLNVLL